MDVQICSNKQVQRLICTPLKTNMAPENRPLEKEIPNLETTIVSVHICFPAGYMNPSELKHELIGFLRGAGDSPNLPCSVPQSSQTESEKGSPGTLPPLFHTP